MMGEEQMMKGTRASEQPPRSGDYAVLDEIYRQLVVVHHALATTGQVDRDLHRTTLQRLSRLIDLVDGAVAAAKPG
jgi:hypothetical protein